MRIGPIRATLALSLSLFFTTPIGAAAQPAPPAPGYSGVGLFQMPTLHAAERQAARRAASGDFAGAAAALDQLAQRFQGAARLQADRAVLAAAMGQDNVAFDALARAVALGLSDLDALLARPPLDRLAAEPRIAALLAAAPAPVPAAAPPPPARVDTGEALVSTANTYWSAADERLVARFEMLDAMRRFQIRDGKLEGPFKTLQSWVARGQAAGNVGDLYDNRDGGHSPLSRRKPTQISNVVYSAEAKAAGVHYGLNTQILFNRITIGNSSTAIQGSNWRSQPRLALTSPDGVAQLWRLYAANHIYVFPEHRDHDPVTPPTGATGPDAKPGHGDLFPANTPYMLISQGSSGSDRPVLEALRAILAAFRPDVKTFLEERDLIAPTLQQIFRRGQKGILDDAAYLSPAAHPVVSDPDRIEIGRMISLANTLRVEDVPPVVVIQVEEEDTGAGIAILLGADSAADERLFDSPSAIARLWRGAGYTRRYVIGTTGTIDPNGRALKFHWRLTQNDLERVTIRPLDEAGTRAEITVRWGGPTPETLRPDITSPRVDIAVIADNGAELSAPAFFSVLYPSHETRVYEGEGDDARLVSIDHGADRGKRRYVDPMIWPRRDWSDVLDYDVEGRLLGWTRSRGKSETRFTRDGLLVREVDAEGRPLRAEAIEYGVEAARPGVPALVEIPTGKEFLYEYDGPGDLTGEAVPAPG
ncbi:hypothetical protein G5B40_08930 [Pikeienuella piscinae]|uniref:Uncharacterized protein n=1 Tax=Pikeienuella piscinae TaxID=2748098 RepID=A0A7L5BXJ6_9RHOB|nr:hypothetical protein [Pikeienuella piscinae]QIE55568.1 hypothetical protein G5B40_08930 [Pikeienuella piscinae]